MAYGKILVDQIENSNGDTFDLSHNSLTDTDASNAHPASSIYTDGGSTVQDEIEQIYSDLDDASKATKGHPSLSVPFSESGKLDKGVGTEYVSGLPVYGIDFTRASSIDLLQRDGTFKTFATDEPGISFQGLALHSSLTNIVTDNSDMTSSIWEESEATVSLNGSDYGLNLYDLVGTTTEAAHYTELTTSTSGGSRFTLNMYAKKTDDYYLSLVFRTEDYSNRAIVHYALDGSGTVIEENETNLAIVKAVSKTAGGLVWIKLEVEFDDDVDTSTLTPIIGPSDSTGERAIAGDGSTAMLTFGGVNIFETGVNVPVNIATTGTTASVSASNASIPCQGNINMPSDFALVVDVPRSGYGRILSIDTLLYVTYESYANGGAGLSINGNYSYNEALYESDDVMRLIIVFDYSQSSPLLYIDGESYNGPSVSMDTFDSSSPLSAIYLGRNSSASFRLQSSIMNLNFLPYAPSADEVKSWGVPK